MSQTSSNFPDWHGTTILAVRKDGQTVIAGDGQVSMGQTVVKGNARKVRTLAGGRVARVVIYYVFTTFPLRCSLFYYLFTTLFTTFYYLLLEPP